MQEIFRNSFQLIVDKFVLGIPNFLMAIILTIIGFLIAKFISKIVHRLLKAIKADRVGEMFNNIDVIQKNNIKIKVSSIISKFIYYIILLIFLIAATDILQMEVLSNLVRNTIEFIPNLMVAVLVLIVGILIADKLRALILTTCESLGIPSAKVISSFVFYFVFITIFVMALSQANINTKFLSQNISILLAGVVLAFSIGYGFASKDLISNYIASFTLKNKFTTGNTIEVNGLKGVILEIDKTSVILETEKGRTLIPINKLLNEDITIIK